MDLEKQELRAAILAGSATVSRISDAGGGIFRNRKALETRLMRILAEIRNFGVEQVRAELERQA